MSETVGRATPLVPEHLGRLGDGHRSLLEATRQTNLPDPVAEVPTKLSQDRRRGVGDEARAATFVEAVERLDETEAGDLEQILELLGRPPVAQRE